MCVDSKTQIRDTLPNTVWTDGSRLYERLSVCSELYDSIFLCPPVTEEVANERTRKGISSR